MYRQQSTQRCYDLSIVKNIISHIWNHVTQQVKQEGGKRHVTVKKKKKKRHCRDVTRIYQ